VRRGEGAVLLGTVVADGVDPDDLALRRDLDRAGHDGDLDELRIELRPGKGTTPSRPRRVRIVRGPQPGCSRRISITRASTTPTI
jgi:hypothetical protein